MSVASEAKWPSYLGKPADPLENVVLTRAQSILTEVGAVGPLLPYDQARDVVRWHESHLRRLQGVSLGHRLRQLFHLSTNDKGTQQ